MTLHKSELLALAFIVAGILQLVLPRPSWWELLMAAIYFSHAALIIYVERAEPND